MSDGEWCSSSQVDAGSGACRVWPTSWDGEEGSALTCIMLLDCCLRRVWLTHLQALPSP
jgi:hypothetical protein